MSSASTDTSKIEATGRRRWIVHEQIWPPAGLSPMKRLSSGIRATRIIWSQESLDKFRRLEHQTRDQILRRVEFLKHSPLLYRVESEGRWAGLRRFRADEVIVFYAYWQQNHSLH